MDKPEMGGFSFSRVPNNEEKQIAVTHQSDANTHCGKEFTKFEVLKVRSQTDFLLTNFEFELETDHGKLFMWVFKPLDRESLDWKVTSTITSMMDNDDDFIIKETQLIVCE